MAEPKGWSPDRKYVLDLWEDIKQRYTGRNEAIKKYREIRFLEEDFEIPEAYQATATKIKTGLPMMWVQREVGALATLPFSVVVPPPPNPTQDDLTNGSKIERFLPAMWAQMERQQKKDIYRNFIDHMVADGVGVLKAYYKPNAWQGMPELAEMFGSREEYSPQELEEYNARIDVFTRTTPLPFAIRTVDPMTVYPIWGEFGLDALIEVSTRPLLHVQRMASPFGGLPLSADEAQQPSEVVIMEFWDPTWMALLVDDGGSYKFVGKMKHGYGRIPYWIANGEETGSSDPKYNAISTLFKIKDVNSSINQLVTVKFNRAMLVGYPSFQSDSIVPDEDGEGGQPKAIPLELGKINPKDPESEGITGIPIPEFSADIEQMISMLVTLSSQTQIGEAAAGGDSFSGESGFLRMVRTEQARTGYHQIIGHAERELTDLLSWILEMIEKKGLRLWVLAKRRDGSAWIELGEEEINGYYNAQAKIEPYNPIMDVARGTYARNQSTGDDPFWSRRFAHEFSGTGQPDEMEDEIIAEQIVRAMRQQIADAAIARLGFGGPGQQAQPTLLGPNGQPIDASMMGSMGGRPTGMPTMPGQGMPLAGPANQPGSVPIRPAG